MEKWREVEGVEEEKLKGEIGKEVWLKRTIMIITKDLFRFQTMQTKNINYKLMLYIWKWQRCKRRRNVGVEERERLEVTQVVKGQRWWWVWEGEGVSGQWCGCIYCSSPLVECARPHPRVCLHVIHGVQAEEEEAVEQNGDRGEATRSKHGRKNRGKKRRRENVNKRKSGTKETIDMYRR